MCGITGIFNYSQSPHLISESILKKMTDVIAHRGPDDSGIYISPDHVLGFGFHRLAIIDLSPAGHQPMSNARQLASGLSSTVKSTTTSSSEKLSKPKAIATAPKPTPKPSSTPIKNTD
jgi:glutamine phosphoribosylpyrophosphate amidotransferase